MLSSVDFSGRPFHFIGIGGIGMSALAYILTEKNLPVSGSDTKSSHITRKLQERGAQIFWGQEANNLKSLTQKTNTARPAIAAVSARKLGGSPNHPIHRTTEVAGCVVPVLSPTAPPELATNPHETHGDLPLLPQVICSTAIQLENAEYRAACELGCPIFHRSDLLAALMQNYQGIAIAGTHGKTTTSSAIGHVLLEAGLDPTIVVGGEVSAWGGNARLGQSDYLVAEADESDGSLVKLSAAIGVVTNIELDHPDHYTTLDQVTETFQAFSRNCQQLVGCIDCATVRDNLSLDVTYSLDPNSGADYTAQNIVCDDQGVSAQIFERGTLLGRVQLRLLGLHNLSNALAVIAVGRLLKLDFEAIAAALGQFQGASRRFEYRGSVDRIEFYDDYAHHPSEIRVTLAAARHKVAAQTRHGQPGRVVAVFQPHRYSRTQTFLADFAQAFGDADLAVVTEIYSAGEANPRQLSGQHLVDAMVEHHPQVVFQATPDDVRAYLTQTLNPGDLVLFLGAGNLNHVVPDVINDCQERQEQLSA